MRFRFRWEVWSSCCTSGLILPFSEQFLKLSESQLIVCQLLHQDQHLCSPHTHNHVAHPAGSTWMSAFLENSLFYLLGPDASPGPQVLPTVLKLWCVVFLFLLSLLKKKKVCQSGRNSLGKRPRECTRERREALEFWKAMRRWGGEKGEEESTIGDLFRNALRLP